MIVCPTCQATNYQGRHTCLRCRASLVAVQVAVELDAAEAAFDQSLTSSRFHLAKAEGELLTMKPGSEREWLATRVAWVQGNVHYRAGYGVDARRELLTALSLLERLPDNALRAGVLNLLGILAYNATELEAAASYFQQATVAAEPFADHALLARAFSNLGIISMEQGDVAAAAAFYARGLQEAEASSQPTAIANSLRTLALLHAEHGPGSLAVSYIERALELRPHITDTARLLLLLGDAGDVFAHVGELERAAAIAHEGYELSQRSEGKYLYDAILVTQATIQRWLGNHEGWRTAATRAFYAPTASPTWQMEAAAELTRYHIAQRNFEQVVHYLAWLRQRPVKRAEMIPLLDCLLAAAQGHLAEAALHFADVRSALAESGKLWLADALADYGRQLLTLGNDESTTTACDLLREAADLYTSLDLPRRCLALEPLL